MGVLRRWGVSVFSAFFLFGFSLNVGATDCWQQWWYNPSTGDCVQVKVTPAGSVEWAFQAESQCACYKQIKNIVCEDAPRPDNC